MAKNEGTSAPEIQAQIEKLEAKWAKKFEDAQLKIQKLEAGKSEKKSSNQLKEGPLLVNWNFIEEFFREEPSKTEFPSHDLRA